MNLLNIDCFIMTKFGPQLIVEALILRERGWSVKEMSSHSRCSRWTIQRNLKLYYSEKRIVGRKKGRRSKLSEDQSKQLEQTIIREPQLTLREVRDKLNLSIHWSTVRRYARRLKRPKLSSPKKFSISPANCEKRVETAWQKLSISPDLWKDIVFTDESGIDNCSEIRRRVFRPIENHDDPNFYLPYLNSSLRHMNFFSWVSEHGVGEIVTWEGRLDSAIYCQIMADLIAHLKEPFGNEDFFIYHDNAAFSRSRETIQFLSERDLEKFFIPVSPYSPGMNIIEDLWAILKQNVRPQIAASAQPKSENEHYELVCTTWKEIPIDVVNGSYESLPRRMLKIIESLHRQTVSIHHTCRIKQLDFHPTIFCNSCTNAQSKPSETSLS